MLFHRLRDYSHVFLLALLALAISLGWFALDGNVNVNLSDEGYLWYGTTALRHGQVPMRDFQAYDPGRYVWTAAWSFILGENLSAMRLACVLFQCLGVTAGCLAARRLSRSAIFLACVALMLCAWMQPRYKVFEQSIALTFILSGVLLLERPTIRRHFAAGILGGAMAFFGRNHGAYHVVAFALMIAWSARGERAGEWLHRGAVWCGGLLCGYIPQWFMFLFVPGYFRAFAANLADVFKHGTNLPMPVPWPWCVSPEWTHWVRWLALAEGGVFVAIPAFLLLAATLAASRRRALHSVLVSAACVTLPYSHYAFSRPDLVHLGHCAPALALGFLALGFAGSSRVGFTFAGMALIASTLANLREIGAAIALFTEPHSLSAVHLAGGKMIALHEEAAAIAAAQKLDAELVAPDEPILFLPNLPGLYPVVRRFSPTRNIYFIFPATPDEDRAALAEIQTADVRWVMLRDYALDGRDELRFSNTNPIVSQYLRENFEPVPMAGLPPDTIILHRTPNP